MNYEFVRRTRLSSHDVPHDLLLECTLADEPVHIHDFLLPESVCTVHCLQILHWVPIMFDKNDRVGACQRESKPANMCLSSKQSILGSALKVSTIA